MPRRVEKLWPWLGGFLISVNLYLLPFLEESPRATDMAGALLLVWLVVELARHRQPAAPLALAGVLALTPLIWLFFSYLNDHGTTLVLAARWLLALPCALALMRVLDDEERQARFAWGLIHGGLVGTGVIVLQWLGFEQMLQLVGLSSSHAEYHHYVALTVRIPGLHGQHNASSSVVSLLVPAAFFLYFTGRLRLPALAGVLFALLVTLHLTSTRSPLIVAVLTIGFASVLAKRVGRSLLIAFFLLSVLVPVVAVYGPPGGWARWKNLEALNSNATERLDSTLGAAELSITHPWGWGAKTGQRMLSEKTGIGATHNAFLQTSLVFGMLQGLILLTGFVVLILRGTGGADSLYFLPSLLAFHTAGLFMFEEHLNNPTFVILAAWVILTAFSSRLRSGKSLSGSP